ncbi:MAG: hypothetical protein F4Y41_04680 [Gammaproteobacteria bacterium]|nr:hypothetical protein [Gammaproteobacteria bacterium]MYI22320.1 hypothetical protein [Gammaproteobacteria bacterium]
MTARTSGTPFGRLALGVKFFERREYATTFRSGFLYANRLGYFRDMEDKERGDPDEGLVLREGGELSIADEDGEYHPLDLVGPVKFDYGHTKYLNVLCLTLFQSQSQDEPTIDMVHDVKAQMAALLDTIRSIGSHAVLLTDFGEFLHRARNAADELGYQCWSRSVTYYDTYPLESWRWSNTTVQPAFLKPRAYELQREYRIVLNTRTYTDDAITVPIGDIRDISFYSKTEDLPNLRWRFTPGEARS